MAEGEAAQAVGWEWSEPEDRARFSYAAFCALLVSLAAHASHLLLGFRAEWLFAVNLGIMGLLVVAAVRRRNRGAVNDIAVPSETIVAFGVLSLILGLAVAAFPFLTGSEQLSFDAPAIKKLSIPFLQGLAMAGIAPVIAVILRNFAAESDSSRDPVGDMADVGRAAGKLAKEMTAATASVAKLRKALATTAQETEDGANAIGASMKQLSTSLETGSKQVATSLSSGATKIETEVQNLSNSLARALDLNQVTTAISVCEQHVSAFNSATQAGTVQVASLKKELEQLQQAAASSAQLLESLTVLIASVERFVEPRTAAPRPNA